MTRRRPRPLISALTLWNAATARRPRRVLPVVLALLVLAAIVQPPRASAKAVTAPSGVTVSQASATSLTLGWQPVANSTGYDLYLNGSKVAKTQSLAYAYRNLSCGKSYTLGVDSYLTSGRTSRIVKDAATTAPCSTNGGTPPPDTTPPSAPTNLRLSSATATSLTLAWTASTDNVGVTAYNLYANNSLAGTTSSTSYGFGGLTCGTSYSLSVTASDAAGNLSQAASVQASTSPCPDTSPPLMPTLLTQNGSTGTSISLSWNASLDNVLVVGYGMFVNGSQVATTSLTNGTFTGLSCGKSYTLGVDAYDAAGNHSPQASVVASTAACAPPSDTSAPTAPTGLRATSVSASSVSLGWTASTDNVGVAGYNVYVDGVLSSTTSSSAYTVSLLLCGTTHTFGVKAFDQAGNLSPLTTISATTTACAPTPTPTVCSKTLAVGGISLSSFLSSLKPGDVGCLHGGVYTAGTLLTWGANGTAQAPITLTEYPGEQATIVGTTLELAGDYLTVRGLTVRDVLTVDGDGIAVSGTGDRVDHNEITSIYRQGILLHTDSANAVIVGNYVHDTGQAGSNQDHGIYVQGNGHRIINNVFAQMRGGYGIHVYPSSSNVMVAENTVVGSQTRSGIIVDTTGGNITVVNNIVAGNADYGIVNSSCALGGCLIDHNLAWNNNLGTVSGPATNTMQADPKFVDSYYHVATGSPAIDAARSDDSFSPDRDGTPRPLGNAPDLGAYEK
jgi:chitodextrinase